MQMMYVARPRRLWAGLAIHPLNPPCERRWAPLIRTWQSLPKRRWFVSKEAARGRLCSPGVFVASPGKRKAPGQLVRRFVFTVVRLLIFGLLASALSFSRGLGLRRNRYADPARF